MLQSDTYKGSTFQQTPKELAYSKDTHGCFIPEGRLKAP